MTSWKLNKDGRSLGQALALAALVTAASTANAQETGAQNAPPEREITNVTGNLYRFRQIRHIGMFLVTPEGIIVVDPTNSELAGWLKLQLDERFGLPVRYVIYSHGHNDHASGGEVFADTATFIGHENMRANLQRPPEDAPLLPREQLWDANGDGLIQENEIDIAMYSNNFARRDSDGNGGLNRAEIWAARFGGNQVPPDITYTNRATMRLGGKTVELHYTGRNHSDDMTVVLFPEERTIYTVDFLTPNRPPRTELDGGFLPEWVDSLRRVEELDFDIISPGHESPGTKAHVTEQREYLEELVAAVEAGIAEGRTREELVETIVMEDYDHLIEYDYSRAGNVAGAYEILISNR